MGGNRKTKASLLVRYSLDLSPNPVLDSTRSESLALD